MITKRYAQEVLDNYGQGIYRIEFELEITQKKNQPYVALAAYSEKHEVFRIYTVKGACVNWIDQDEDEYVLPGEMSLAKFYQHDIKLIHLKWLSDV